MYILTLEINQKCNLKCKYCYLGDKSGSQMSLETAYNAIDSAFKNVLVHKDHKLWIDFIGGEPLLDFDMIQKLVKYIYQKNQHYKNVLFFSLTTNATIFNQEIINFLIENNFSLKISIDGDKEINDLNRITVNGTGVYDRVHSNLKYLKEFEKKTGKYVQVTNVITGNNYEQYYETLVHLTKNLGFKIIDTGIDLGYDWADEQIVALEQSIKKSFDYFIEMAANQKGFRWEFADKVVNLKKERKKFYSCGAGIVSMYVRTDGGIYACPGNLDCSVELGNVNSGVIRKKIEKLKEFKEIKNDKCNKCEIAKYCVEQSCMMQNLAITGDINTPVPILCRMRKLMYEIYKEKQNVIKRLVM